MSAWKNKLRIADGDGEQSKEHVWRSRILFGVGVLGIVGITVDWIIFDGEVNTSLLLICASMVGLTKLIS